jgi:hypothetical protein
MRLPSLSLMESRTRPWWARVGQRGVLDKRAAATSPSQLGARRLDRMSLHLRHRPYQTLFL